MRHSFLKNLKRHRSPAAEPDWSDLAGKSFWITPARIIHAFLIVLYQILTLRAYAAITN
jgi:hypothetical protein